MILRIRDVFPAPMCLLLGSVLPVQGQEHAADRTGWLIAADPVAVVGTELSGRPLSTVGSGVRLSDGRIVIADGGLNSRLSVFSPNGEYMEQIGRGGEGPGEYKWISSLQVGPEDSLIVYDASLQRLSIFTSQGEFQRSVNFRMTPGVGSDGLLSVRRLTDGVWVGRGVESVRPGPVKMIVRDTVVLGLLDRTLTNLRSLDRIPGRMTTSTLLMGRPVAHLPSFTPAVVTATWGQCVFASSAETATISVYDAEATLVARFDGPGSRRRVTREHVALRLRDRIESFPDANPRSWERLLSEEARPEYLPYYHRIIVDDRGLLWLQEYAPPDGIGTRFFVVTQTGEFLSEVEMPHRLRALAIGEAGVLARRVVEYGVEVVELLPFSRRPRAVPPPLAACVVPRGARPSA